jgi:hypothetical protein
MTDLRSLSDEQLQQMYSQMKGQSQAAPSPAGGLQGMSDEQLQQLLQQKQQAEASRSPTDRLMGRGGERYQTWPERLVRGIGDAIHSGVTLPRDVMTEAQKPRTQISDSDVSTLTPKRAIDTVTLGAPINPGVRAGDRAFAGELRRKPGLGPAPSQDELLRVGGNQMNQARDMGVEYTAEGMRNLGARIEQRLEHGVPGKERGGSNATVAPETFDTLSSLRNPPKVGGDVTGVNSSFENVQNLRETLGEVAGSADRRERRAATRAIRELDEWLSTGPSQGGEISALAGSTAPETAEAAAKAYATGRGNYAAGMRSAEVTGTKKYALDSAQAANSGLNKDNRIRQRFLAIANDDATTRGFSPEEVAQLERIHQGARTTNFARRAGNMLGGGGGLGQTMVAGAGAGAGAYISGGEVGGAALGAMGASSLGSAARHLANALTGREANRLDEMIRRRSPLYLQQPATHNHPKVDPLVRALLLGTNSDQQ